MRKVIFITLMIIQTNIIYSQENELLPEIQEYYDEGNQLFPKSIFYKNLNLETVKKEFYDETGNISYSVNYKYFDGYGFYYDGDVEFTPSYFNVEDLIIDNKPIILDELGHINKGKFIDGVLNIEDFQIILGQTRKGGSKRFNNDNLFLMKTSIVNGSIEGYMDFYSLSVNEKDNFIVRFKNNTNPKYLFNTSREELYGDISIKYFNEIITYKVDSLIVRIPVKNGIIMDGEYQYDNYTKVKYSNGTIESIVRKNSNLQITDSLNRNEDIWKIDGKFHKNHGMYLGDVFDPINYFESIVRTNKKKELIEYPTIENSSKHVNTVYFDPHNNYIFFGPLDYELYDGSFFNKKYNKLHNSLGVSFGYNKKKLEDKISFLEKIVYNEGSNNQILSDMTYQIFKSPRRKLLDDFLQGMGIPKEYSIDLIVSGLVQPYISSKERNKNELDSYVDENQNLGDILPKFRNSNNDFQTDFQNFIQENIIPPVESEFRKEKISYEFVIGTDGFVKDIKVGEGIRSFRIEVLRLISLLPPMFPYIKDNKPVSVPYSNSMTIGY